MKLNIESASFKGSNITEAWYEGNLLFKMVPVPTVSGSLTFNGNSQSPTISAYDSSIIQVSGNSATNAGDYTVTFHLKDTDRFRWADGTTADKTASWSIAPMDISGFRVTLGPELYYSTSVQTKEIVSVKSADGNFTATYTATGNTVEANFVGSKTITITGTGNYTGTVTAYFGVDYKLMCYCSTGSGTRTYYAGDYDLGVLDYADMSFSFNNGAFVSQPGLTIRASANSSNWYHNDAMVGIYSQATVYNLEWAYRRYGGTTQTIRFHHGV